MTFWRQALVENTDALALEVKYFLDTGARASLLGLRLKFWRVVDGKETREHKSKEKGATCDGGRETIGGQNCTLSWSNCKLIRAFTPPLEKNDGKSIVVKIAISGFGILF